MLNKEEIEIIIVDDDEAVRENTVDLLSTIFGRCKAYESAAEVISLIKPNLPWVILTDLRMPEYDGLQFAKKVHEIDSQLPVLLMTGYGEVSIAVQAMKQGIYDFVEKPFDTDVLIESLKRAVDKRFLDISLQETQAELAYREGIDSRIIGQSASMRQLKDRVVRLASVDVPVMIYGETGSGKEMVARSLHEYSGRKDKPFVALNCAAIPDHLAESELFGHAKGAFTDAHQARVGKLEHANGGTLFLDEVESLPLALQAKLLRALSDQKVTPLGSNQEVDIDCRIISATKDDLRNNESFRQDLFFRLQVALIEIPPLKDREEDILSLFEYFAVQQCEQFGIEYKPSSAVTKAALMRYEWPGNVRELINVATRYAIDQCIDIHDVDSSQDLQGVDVANANNDSLKDQVSVFEASLLRSKLEQHEGKVALVLDDLQIERRTFNQKLNKYGLVASDFRQNKNGK